MKNTNWLALALATLFTVSGACMFPARAAEAAAPRPSRAEILERIKEKLGVTDDQVAKIKAQLEPAKDTLRDLIARLHEARAALRAAVQSPDATEAAIRSAAAKVAAVEADLAVARHKLYAKVKAMLTPEQIEKIKLLQDKIDDLVDSAITRLGERLGSKAESQ